MHKVALTLKIALILLGVIVAVVTVQTLSGNPQQAKNLLSDPAVSQVLVRLRNIDITSGVARTTTEQAHGLSDRPVLGELEGLLFVFDREVTPAFWMQDMLFPIDIVWLSKDWRVVGMVKDFRPESFPQTVEPPQPVQYVLEVNAGLTDQLNVKVGDVASVLAK
jgi:uncharacterized membrane protein (UPF0127 family)